MLIYELINKLNRDIILEIINKGYALASRENNIEYKMYIDIYTKADEGIEYLEFDKIKYLFEQSIIILTNKSVKLSSTDSKALENRFWCFDPSSITAEEILVAIKTKITEENINKFSNAGIKDMLKVENKPLKVGNKECPIAIVNDIAAPFLFRSITNSNKSFYTNSDLEKLFETSTSLATYANIYNADIDEIKRQCDIAYDVTDDVTLKDLTRISSNCIPIAFDERNFKLYANIDKSTICLDNNIINKILTSLKKVEIGSKTVPSRVVSIDLNLANETNNIKLSIPKTVILI